MDLLQLLILLVITGICGAFAVLFVGFCPPGLMIMLFSLICGVVGAALGVWIKGGLGIPNIFTIQVGTISLDIVMTFVGSIAVVWLLQVIYSFQRSSAPRAQP